MKKLLLGGTALTAAAFVNAPASAAEEPIWQLSGNANFQFYWVDQDFIGFNTSAGEPTIAVTTGTADVLQEHGWYFGVDEAELQINVDGATDNGLHYGFKIEINANTTDNSMADEARLQFSGGWGTLQLGDEDGAEDIMNYGGETLMGAAGGFDGDIDDVLIRQTTALPSNAPSFPVIAGDTGDSTKVSYFTPRLVGFQAGASLTPTPNDGDDFKADGDWENHIGLGANYDNAFGGLRLRASAVYSAASSNVAGIEDVSAWSVGALVGWGGFSLGGNYTDNGDSGETTLSGNETSYWNLAAGFDMGPLYLSAGYFESTKEHGIGDDSTFTNIALTVDYSLAPGLTFYAEADLIEDDMLGAGLTTGWDNDATIFIAGANVSF